MGAATFFFTYNVSYTREPLHRLGENYNGCQQLLQRSMLLLVSSEKLGSRSVFAVFGVIIAPDPIRSDSTQLSRRISEHVQNSATGKNWAKFDPFQFFSIARVIIAPNSLWSLLRSDSTQINYQLSWVESDRALWSRLYNLVKFASFKHILNTDVQLFTWHLIRVLNRSIPAYAIRL